MDASFLEVDVAAIRRNYRRLRDLVGPQTRICPVIKGNAYGMGASEVGRVLQQAGASMLAVYDANEALEVLEEARGCCYFCGRVVFKNGLFQKMVKTGGPRRSEHFRQN